MGAVEQVAGRGDWRDEQQTVQCGLEQLGFGAIGAEATDDFGDPFILLERLPTVDEHVSVVEPVLVASGGVAVALLVDPLHEPAREGTDRGPEQEHDVDESVAAWPESLERDGTHAQPAVHPLH